MVKIDGNTNPEDCKNEEMWGVSSDIHIEDMRKNIIENGKGATETIYGIK